MGHVYSNAQTCKHASKSLFNLVNKPFAKNICLVLLLFMFSMLSLPLIAQTFDWEPATTSDDGNVNGGKVYSTVGDISVEVSSTVSAGGLYISLFDMSSYPSYGASGYIAFASVTNVQSITFDFTAGGPVDIQSIYAVEVGGTSGTWTYTPTGGSNTPVTDNISASTGQKVDLNWTDVTSFTVSKSESLSGFGFDDLVLGATEPPAPITLSSFTINTKAGQVELAWETASETNNAYYMIYRNDMMIARVDGAGTSSEPHSYSFADKDVVPGVTYTYVLADVDYGNTINKFEDHALTITLNNDLVAKDFTVGNAYPNPFNPTTVIPLTLSNASLVTANLYDLAGHQVKALTNTSMSAGSHAITIDGSDLMSGIYMVKVTMGNTVDMRKILLLK